MHGGVARLCGTVRGVRLIYRLWTTGVDPAKVDRYRNFARQHSLPMFQEQPGFRGVTFLQDGDQHWVLTMWDAIEDVERLASSESYLSTARALGALGILTGKQQVRLLMPELTTGAGGDPGSREEPAQS